MDEDDKVIDKPEPQPMMMGEVLEWISTICIVAAWFWRKGYERGQA